MRTATTATRTEQAPALPSLLWDDVGVLVDRVLADWVSASRSAASTDSVRQLWERVGTGLEGGKRVRPQLVFHAYSAFGGTDPQACATLGAAIELLHGALVVHDDVIDRDFVRRGRPNISGLYRDDAASHELPPEEAGHRGASVAVIAGDLLLAGAFRLCDRSSRDVDVRERLSEVMHTAVVDAAAGELEDVLMAHDPGRTLEEVLEMERLKTAAYSFAAPLRLGTILAGAPAARAADVARVGMLVGTAYQVIDDVLGTFGDEHQTGKPVTSDLRERKLTVLTAYARTHPEVARHLAGGAEDGNTGVDRVRSVLREVGADTHALTLAHTLATEALDEARRCDLPPALRSELTRICNHVLHREH